MSEPILNYLEIVNESLILTTIYFMIIFTNFVQDIQARYYFGFILNFYIIVVISINIGFIVYNQYKAWKKKRDKKKYDKAWANYD